MIVNDITMKFLVVTPPSIYHPTNNINQSRTPSSRLLGIHDAIKGT